MTGNDRDATRPYDSAGLGPVGGQSTALLLAVHVAATVLVQSVATAIFSILPVLARVRFGAGDWQTLVLTAAVPTFSVLSIFWNVLLSRITRQRYLAVHWCVNMLPLSLVAVSQNYGQMLACYVVAAAGGSGWSPIHGELMHRFYPDDRRGRAFGVLTAAMLIGTMSISLWLGRWLNADGDAFRVFMPIAAILEGVGIVILIVMVRATRPRGAGDARAERRSRRQVAPADGGSRPQVVPPPPDMLQRAFSPLVHMRDILRADRVFYRFEAAFMTYGLGWMICNALLPVLVTRKLNMDYAEITRSTQVAYSLCMLVTIYPMGWLLDRLGAARTSSAAFAWLGLYPLGLVLAQGPMDVTIASGLFGMAMAGVQVGWLLGPVKLAPRPDMIAHYVAIHTTLVGLRGIVAQFLGMLIYRLTGSFTWSFGIAAAGFAWAAVQMWQLHRFAAARQPARDIREPIET